MVNSERSNQYNFNELFSRLVKYLVVYLIFQNGLTDASAHDKSVNVSVTDAYEDWMSLYSNMENSTGIFSNIEYKNHSVELQDDSRTIQTKLRSSSSYIQQAEPVIADIDIRLNKGLRLERLLTIIKTSLNANVTYQAPDIIPKNSYSSVSNKEPKQKANLGLTSESSEDIEEYSTLKTTIIHETSTKNSVTVSKDNPEFLACIKACGTDHECVRTKCLVDSTYFG